MRDGDGLAQGGSGGNGKDWLDSGLDVGCKMKEIR